MYNHKVVFYIFDAISLALNFSDLNLAAWAFAPMVPPPHLLLSSS